MIKIYKNNSEIFFASDAHFGHKKIIEYDKRPFETVEEMEDAIVKNWNSVVSKDDVVFYLGDLYLGRRERGKNKEETDYNTVSEIKRIVDRLNGTIYYCLGNHDNERHIKATNRFKMVANYYKVAIYDKNSSGVDVIDETIILSHFPILTWDGDHRGNIHVHGHTHHSNHHIGIVKEYYSRKVLDAGLNGINYTPISLTEIKEKMKGRIVLKHHD